MAFCAYMRTSAAATVSRTVEAPVNALPTLALTPAGRRAERMRTTTPLSSACVTSPSRIANSSPPVRAAMLPRPGQHECLRPERAGQRPNGFVS